MKPKNYFLLITIGWVLSLPLKAADSLFSKNPILPQHFTLQYAGNIGLISVGIGAEPITDRLVSELFVGYTPKYIADADIVTLSQKFTYRMYNLVGRNIPSLFPTVGASINLETGKNSLLQLPEKYPKGYYGTKALTFGLFAGSSYQKTLPPDGFLKRVEGYAEVGTLGTYLFYNIKRKEYFNPDIWSLSLGIRLYIK